MDKITGRGPVDYEQAKRLARHKDVKVRLKLAQREDLPPEILYFLAADRSAAVRRAIAKNIAAPGKADLLLSRDADDDVRVGLAEKIGRLMPDLSPSDVDKLSEATHQVLELLAHDQALRVRRILSETLKDIAHAPPEVIVRLARDVELVVCAPVLEHSPVLTDADLLAIISSSPVRGALSAIAARRALTEGVSDAVYAVATEVQDDDAIGVMLGNASAQIREDTLDRIIDRAETISAWQVPLAERPKLSRKAVLRLAEFVAEHAMDTLKNRTDIDAATAAAVHEEFSRRMEAAERARARDEGGTPSERAQSLFDQGELTDALVREAAQMGEEEFVRAALALKAAVKPVVIDKIFDIATVKGVVALCWKAGLSMSTAVVVQKRIVRIAPREVLGSVDGDYPFTTEEMQWQWEFLTDSA